MALAAVSGVGPVLGIAAAGVLREQGVKSIGVKWPNDLQVEGEKLGGILVEVADSRAGQLSLVAGIGVNLALGSEISIDQPWTDLQRLGLDASAEPLARRLASAFFDALECMATSGLAAALSGWEQFDALAGKTVTVLGGARAGGRVLGIAEDGRLRLQDEQGEWRCHAGEVSVRPTSCC